MKATEGGRQLLRTLVVIPAYNEEEALPETLRGLREAAGTFDVLVVDDGSVDATAQVAAACGAMVARLPFNIGVGGALRTGFRFAVRNGYERAVQFDADGQHEPGDVMVLLGQLDAGADLVVGTRFGEGPRRYRTGAIRGRAMGLLRLILNVMVGRRFTDTSSGFRAFSRPMLEFFAREYPVEYLADTVEALLIACYAGFTVVETPASMRPRAAGQPSHRTGSLIYHYLRLIVALAAMASVRRRAALRTGT